MSYPRKTGKRIRIPLTKPFFDGREEKAVVDTLRSGWHTQGPQTEKFEKEFAKCVNAKYAVAVSNCTTALFLSLIVLGINAHDEVIVPSFTYIATVNAIKHAQATPVFAEVEQSTFNIDPNRIEAKITKKTRAIITVDQVGLPYEIDEVKKIAVRNNLVIIEDAACALGSEYKKEKIGSLSSLTCFSLHPRKLISTGEGGVITTNNKSLSEKLKKLRSHGASIGDHTRHTINRVSFESYKNLGYNFRITDIQSAIGREQLKKLPAIIKKRTLLANRYTKSLTKISVIKTPYVPSYAKHNWQSYIISLEKDCPLSPEEIMQKLLDKGISTRRGVMASHIEPYYKNLHEEVSLPITERLAKSTISLPIYPQMTVNEQNYVIKNIIQLLSQT